MVTTLGLMLDDLRVRLDDATDVKYPRIVKVQYINYGIRATWPSLFKTVRDFSIALADGTYEYALPGGINSNARVYRVEFETSPGSGRFFEWMDYEIIPHLTDPLIVFGSYPLRPAGELVRISACVPLKELAIAFSGDEEGDVYDGPLGTEELPVLYAMGVASAEPLSVRLDYKRYSTQVATNGVDVAEVSSVAQMWFAQFWTLLNQFEMPQPVSH